MESVDFVIVGSGAGGAPLAANLAEAGYEVLVLEAGGDDTPEVYPVPAFHALASEDAAMSWDVFVEHYADEERAALDSKRVPGKGRALPPCRHARGLHRPQRDDHGLPPQQRLGRHRRAHR